MKGEYAIMEIVLLKDKSELEEGLRSLIDEFKGEYSYYEGWVRNNTNTFRDGSRVVYALKDDNHVAGYMMVHYSDLKVAKINGIYVFPEYQKRGIANDAIKQILHLLKEKSYEYVFIQTRIHNKIVVHMFDSLKFDVIGTNFHKIEKANNWLSVYDLNQKRNLKEMKRLAGEYYPGFSAIN
jgi:hypothetical protein